jgi:hypothetical protein
MCEGFAVSVFVSESSLSEEKIRKVFIISIGLMEMNGFMLN